MSKCAFITGSSGMDGKLLIDFLLKKDYKIIGLVRQQSVHEVKHHRNIEYLIGDLTKIDSILEILKYKKIDEIYLLGAQSCIEPSWKNFNDTFETNVSSTMKILEYVRTKTNKTKVFFASSSEIFGDPVETPQTEETEKKPRNPYGFSKHLGQQLIELYRNVFGLFCCSGVLYNHESELRKREVVTTKIIKGVVKIFKGSSEKIILGNIKSIRDWTSAKDFVEGMWMTLQHVEPNDYIFSSNHPHTVEDMLVESFNIVGIQNYSDFIEIDDKFYRPCEVNVLVGDNKKLKSIGWEPKISFKEMIKDMIEYELKLSEL